MTLGSGRRKALPEGNSDYFLEGQHFHINYVRNLGQLDSQVRYPGESLKTISDKTGPCTKYLKHSTILTILHSVLHSHLQQPFKCLPVYESKWSYFHFTVDMREHWNLMHKIFLFIGKSLEKFGYKEDANDRAEEVPVMWSPY